MREPLTIISHWMTDSGDLLSPPPLVRAAYRQVEREDAAEAQHWHDWSVPEMERLLQIIDQDRLEFTQEDSHENVRRAVARYIETVVAPHYGADDKVLELPSRLRAARQTWTRMYRRSDGKHLVIWDDKAGLPLLCPDDAREEAMRVQRRVVPAVMEALKQKGARAYSCVLTDENSAPGSLHKGMRSLWKRLSSLLRKIKRDRSLPILGAYAVMESPLGGYRTWHPHLNVILVTSGWFDFAKLRALWMRNLHVERLEGSQSSIEAALREIIKYSARAVPEKSHAKALAASSDTRVLSAPGHEGDSSQGHSNGPDADQGAEESRPERDARLDRSGHPRPAAPALTEWTAEEFLEWWYAHKGFRRSRGYGCLYRLGDEAEPESLDGFEAISSGSRDAAGRRFERFILLESIPGDKSTTPDARERLRAHIRRLLGDPDRPTRALDLMREAMQAWPEVKNQLS